MAYEVLQSLAWVQGIEVTPLMEALALGGVGAVAALLHRRRVRRERECRRVFDAYRRALAEGTGCDRVGA